MFILRRIKKILFLGQRVVGSTFILRNILSQPLDMDNGVWLYAGHFYSECQRWVIFFHPLYYVLEFICETESEYFTHNPELPI